MTSHTPSPFYLQKREAIDHYFHTFKHFPELLRSRQSMTYLEQQQMTKFAESSKKVSRRPSSVALPAAFNADKFYQRVKADEIQELHLKLEDLKDSEYHQFPSEMKSIRRSIRVRRNSMPEELAQYIPELAVLDQQKTPTTSLSRSTSMKKQQQMLQGSSDKSNNNNYNNENKNNTHNNHNNIVQAKSSSPPLQSFYQKLYHAGYVIGLTRTTYTTVYNNHNHHTAHHTDLHANTIPSSYHYHYYQMKDIDGFLAVIGIEDRRYLMQYKTLLEQKRCLLDGIQSIFCISVLTREEIEAFLAIL